MENNKLIAEFMGLKPKMESPDVYVFNDMPYFSVRENNPEDVMNAIVKYSKYDSDWNWLMEVVEKIESLNFVVQIHLNSCFIKESEHFINNKAIWRGKNHAKTKIEAVYNACIEFIKWYNSHLCANCGIFHNITGVNDLLNMCINKKVL